MSTTNAQRVFDFLQLHPDRTPTQIAEALQLSRQQVKTAIAGLIDWGAIEPEPRERQYRLCATARRPSGWGGKRRGIGFKSLLMAET